MCCWCQLLTGSKNLGSQGWAADADAHRWRLLPSLDEALSAVSSHAQHAAVTAMLQQTDSIAGQDIWLHLVCILIGSVDRDMTTQCTSVQVSTVTAILTLYENDKL